MAVVKVRYTKDGSAAKATIRYIAHRPDKAGKTQYRQLFSEYGAIQRQDVYAAIDHAGEQGYFYHVIISPDPQQEDKGQDLHLRHLTEETFLSLSILTQQHVVWAGVVHADHAPHRHIHALAILPTKLDRQALRSLREQATTEARMQRRELDRYRSSVQEQQQREEEQWEYSHYSS